MWIVRLALSRPRTIAVMAILIALLGVLSISRMAKDIFPAINLPVVSVIWSYGGLAPEEMERRIIRLSELVKLLLANLGWCKCVAAFSY